MRPGLTVQPVQLPIGEEDNFKGVVKHPRLSAYAAAFLRISDSIKEPKSHIMFSAITRLFKSLGYPNHKLLFAPCLQACFALLTRQAQLFTSFQGNDCAGICDLVSQRAAASEVANGLEGLCSMQGN